MSKTNSVEIKCTNPKCGVWFQSPIGFGDMGSFDTSMLIGNTVQCPNCNTMTGCNKENMRVKSNDGGFRGNDTF
ncbi:hypothetical protein [Neobacillus sp. OS1-33]|uniref:hypothetical protein n=1 Tax=Neobacillus sp. OS1-33 TaxID=3070683 RepID=UPI0027E11AFD|nr:hypothetical protein [Neobacillus sp. OS1-33]WML25660.1 hypothetical protein RCG22_23010 [Neobacillus sp. OS1-33]